MVAHSNAEQEEETWFADSGANQHITANLEHLTLQQPYIGQENVAVGNGQGLSIAHTGTTIFHTPEAKLNLKRVLHCPQASANLLSINQFCLDNNCLFILTGTHYFVKDIQTGVTLLEGRSEGGLYPIQLRSMSINKSHALSAVVGIKASVSVWHSRLGHASLPIVSQLLNKHSLPVEGLVNKMHFCEPCQLGKGKQLPFKPSTRVSSFPLQLIHTDVWSCSTKSLSGCKYYVIFIDDFSRFSWLYPLQNKSDVYACFVKFKTLVENQFSCKIKQLQSDGGGEYMSNQFQLFLSSNGIQHRRTCPHTPQQNGVAERKHRHVVEMGLSLLAQSLLPTKFWVDAFLTSIFLINRLPTSTLDNQTPYLKLFGKHPDYTSLRTFGCACFPLLRPYATHKLMFRSKRCIFLGYSSHQNGYRCLDPVTQKVLISRHVVFNENTFPAKDGLQSSELLPVVSSQGTPLPSPSFSLFTSNLQHSSPIISDSPDSPLESLPIPTSPHISTLPSPIPGPAPTLSIPEFSSSSNHSHHPMTTRSQTGNLTPRTFSDFKLYSTHYPLQALSSTVTPLAPTSYRQAALLPDWCVAMREEYDALLANETWKLCPRPVDHNVVGNKWVYKVKQTSTGEVDRFKARLVALGFAQEEGIDFTETFSPVIKPSTVRVLLTLSVQFDWEIRQLDVSNAFLHGILLEDVYMEQPKGFVNSDFPDYVCKLNKSLYGLKQAPRAWFMRLSQTLLEFGFLSSPVDASLFVYHKGHIHLFILIYVDDILVTGTDPSLIQSLIQKLQTEFKMKDLGPLGYFLGIQASRDSSGLHLRQSKYIGDLLHRTKMAGAKPASSPCTTGLKLSTHVGEPLTASQITEYRQTVGALQYCTLTRPDIAFSVNQLCQHMHCPNSVHWTAAKRVLRYLKGTIDLGLWYTKGEQTLQAFCDSDWAGNPDDRRSTTGYGVFFGSCLISWTAKKQSVVARSSTEAEYRALAITTAELYWIRMLLKELHISLPTAPTIWCDNSGALALASNPVFHARTKHIEVDFHFIREKVANRDISLQFIGSYDQPADIFTKGLSLARFCLLRDKLMVVSLPISLRGDDNHNIQTTEISLASHLSYPPDQLRLNETNKHLSTLRDNP